MSEENMNQQNDAEQQAQNNQPVFDIVRVYAKDCSLETPNIPEIFQIQWKPKINVDFDAKPKAVSEDLYEVDLRVTVTCHNDDKVAFICEVHQAGLFIIRNVAPEAREFLLSGTAPNLLFPYAREHIASLVNRATFPPLNLRPLNFEALYRARKMAAQQNSENNNETMNGLSQNTEPQA